MATSRYNPFKPGSIIHPNMFAGRSDELAILDRVLFQTANGNPEHFLIHGERGIGKSSLLMVVAHFAKGTLVPLSKRTYAFLTINIELEPNDEYRDIIQKIARELHRELDRDDILKKMLSDIWGFITNWKVMGVEYKREATPVEAMLEELAEKLIAISAALIRNGQSGIFIFIDEADKPPASAGLGELSKVLTERLAKRGANNIGIGIIGISSVLEKMKDSHESSMRVFTPIQLEPLAMTDRMNVVQRGLVEANAKNELKTSITADALTSIASLSEGYPYFIQQYAFSAFDHDKDGSIDQADVHQALIKENGALQLLGQRYFEGMYTAEIRSDDYRTVLQVLAKHMPQYVTPKQICTESKLKAHTVRNAIAALKKRGSIVIEPGKAGRYRLPSSSFAAWIQAFKVAKIATK